MWLKHLQASRLAGSFSSLVCLFFLLNCLALLLSVFDHSFSFGNAVGCFIIFHWTVWSYVNKIKLKFRAQSLDNWWPSAGLKIGQLGHCASSGGSQGFQLAGSLRPHLDPRVFFSQIVCTWPVFPAVAAKILHPVMRAVFIWWEPSSVI